jgi:hypothetical protein
MITIPGMIRAPLVIGASLLALAFATTVSQALLPPGAYFDVFSQPVPTTLYYGSGDVDGNGHIDGKDVTHLDSLLSEHDTIQIPSNRSPLDWADVNGDEQITTEDSQLIQDYIEGGGETYLPGHWNRLRTREERESWLIKMLAIDKTDTLEYIGGDVWDCSDFTSQTVMNFAGWYSIYEIREKYDTTNVGRFNLPLCNVAISGPGIGHRIVGILTGDDPLEWNDWLLDEPQADFIAEIGEYVYFQPGCNVRINLRGYVTGGSSSILFHINEENHPELVGNSDYLILERPDTQTAVADATTVSPERLELQNYPNPFNSSTAIHYEVCKPGMVRLDIYSQLGQIVNTVFNEHRNAGTYNTSWNGQDQSGKSVASGVYISRLTRPEGGLVGKMTLVR